MFNFRGFIKALGLTLMITLVYGFTIGFFNLLSVKWVVFSTFIVSYGSIGVLAPLWNKRTPYFATYLAAIVMSVINILFSITILRIQVLIDTTTVNENLLFSALFAMFVAYVFVQVNYRIERNNHD